MAVIFAEQDLHNACQVLFGANMQVSPGFLDYLQLSGIKSAYRKKALETHPDKLCQQTEQNEKGDLFMAVQQAYESLLCFIDARKKGYIIQSKLDSPRSTHYHPKKRPSPPAANRQNAYSAPRQTFRQKAQQKTSTNGTRPKTHTPDSASLHKGPIPGRKLLFGHYLYYAGLANWHTITKALIWQRTKRPRIGEIGVRYGWLTREDILKILKGRALSESFGKTAVRTGLLKEDQIRFLILKQKMMQRKFGDYFIAHNILTENQLNHLVQQFRIHNHTVGSTKARYRTM